MKKAVGWMTGTVFLGVMLFAMASNAQGVLLSSFIDAFSLTSGVQGMPNAAYSVGSLVAMLLAVPVAARIGKPLLFAGGMLLLGLMLALTGAAQSAVWLIAAYLVIGLSCGFIDTTASSIIADLHQGKRAPQFMGFLHAVYGLGGIIAPVLMTAALGAGTTWRAVLWTLGAVILVASVVSFLVTFRTRDRLPETVAPPSRLTVSELLTFARQPGNATQVLSTCCYCAHQSIILLWISRIIGTGYGNVALGAAALSLFWVGTVLSRLLVPLTGISTVRYMRYGMLLTTVIMVIGLVVGGAVTLCVVTALAGLIGGATIPMSLSEITRRNPGRSMLAITAVMLTASLSSIIAAPLIGFVVARTSLIAGMVASAIGAGLCSVLAFRLREVPDIQVSTAE